VGLGGSWSELSTTKYTKGADRPPFGIGYDYVHSRCPGCQHDFSTRILMNWVFTGSDWRDGVHGPEISLSMPSPSENGHWSFQERFCVYRFDLTVTDPSNIPLMRSQRAAREFFAVLGLGIAYRF
jgi:hypothetical protein